ncbi:MAG: restriction endonuclease [Armatimonadetes bacterium]|nr:restriction endonuclease [Armatimonadota bacterium]
MAATDSADVAKATLAKSAQASDKLVYELYELSDEEIAIVEEASKHG